ncbi:hypothetical protein [Halomicrobium salinisoli]|uniref:hypothetical protein n=1 Tax=Halomicrobium salinisoli TaxID=2878391 RepID=UPI001CEFD99E|nr:hypothetical protein [Halomicrobium salinisoli]
MSSPGSKLSAKERIGYEVFFFTAVYGLYNVFFTLSLAVDAIVFTTLFGSLFVRYHLVVSNEELDDSRAARWTGTAMFVVSVAIASHLVFKQLNAVTNGFSPDIEPYVILLGGAISGVMLFAVINHSVFRYDEQRRATFREKAEEEGTTGLIARIGLFLERKSDSGNYEFDLESSIDLAESRKLMRKQREGEITPEERDELRQEIKDRRDFGKILIVGFHTAASITLLVLSTALFECLTSVEAVATLGIILLVTGVYSSFSMLHTRFGLRREISRSLPKMPMELLLCILATFASLYNAGVIEGSGIIISAPFTLYLLTNRGGWISQKMILSMMKYIVDTPDGEYSDVIQEVMNEGESSS